MTVAITKANFKDIEKKIAKTLESINYQPKKNKILIKPNLVHPASPESGKVTHPKVVESLIKYLFKFTEDIVIAEGSAVGHDTKESFRTIGYSSLAKKYNIKLIDLNDCERYKVNWEYGKLELPTLLKEREYINVCKMRPHAQTVMTAGIKNQKGLLLPKDKKRFHMTDLHDSIKALLQIVKPDLTVVDALICMEGNVGGLIKNKKKLGLIITGKDVIEVDNVCAEIMGIDKQKVRYMPIKEVKDIIGEPTDKVKKKFKLAKEQRNILNISFNLMGCSGCNIVVGSALSSLQKKPLKLARFFYNSLFNKVNIITGPKQTHEGKNNICIGSCAIRASKDKKSICVQGCPPKIEDVIKAILLVARKQKSIKP